MALFWWFWFTPDEKGDRGNRETILAVFAGGFLALVAARILAVVLPFQIRPLNDPGFIYRLPPSFPGTLEGWSAFPSDHASLFTVMALGFWLLSRPLGCLMFAYAVIIIFIPRIYMGYHTPADIMGGMAIGVFSLMLVSIPRVKKLLAKPFINWSEKHPPSFYCLLFVYSFQISILLGTVRYILEGMWRFYKS